MVLRPHVLRLGNETRSGDKQVGSWSQGSGGHCQGRGKTGTFYIVTDFQRGDRRHALLKGPGPRESFPAPDAAES